MMYFGRLAGEWLPIVVALFVSTIVAIAVAAVLFAALARRVESAENALPGVDR